jgi:hypothetical protein
MLMIIIYWAKLLLTINKNTQIYKLLEMNVNKTEYMVMSREQDTGRNQNIKISNFSLLKDISVQIQEVIKSRLKSGKACYHSV